LGGFDVPGLIKSGPRGCGSVADVTDVDFAFLASGPELPAGWPSPCDDETIGLSDGVFPISKSLALIGSFPLPPRFLGGELQRSLEDPASSKGASDASSAFGTFGGEKVHMKL
jgi:hypothetical protein